VRRSGTPATPSEVRDASRTAAAASCRHRESCPAMESASQFSQVELARIGHAALSSRKMGIAEALAAARPRQAARGPEFSNAPRSDFRRFSDDLYCSGAVEQKCLVGNHRLTAGQCLWYKPQRSLLGAGWAAVTDDDMNATLTPRSALAHHRFDPVRGGAASYGYRHFGRDAAARCVAGKRILVAGDSTTRDTYYELLVVGGHPERVSVPSAPDAYWPPSAYAPRDPGPDRQGRCMGNFDKRVACVRDYRGNATRLAFQFLMRTNASWELDDARKLLAQDGGPPVDAAFVHCPVYEWFKPDAYDYTKTKEQRYDGTRLLDTAASCACALHHRASHHSHTLLPPPTARASSSRSSARATSRRWAARACSTSRKWCGGCGPRRASFCSGRRRCRSGRATWGAIASRRGARRAAAQPPTRQPPPCDAARLNACMRSRRRDSQHLPLGQRRRRRQVPPRRRRPLRHRVAPRHRAHRPLLARRPAAPRRDPPVLLGAVRGGAADAQPPVRRRVGGRGARDTRIGCTFTGLCGVFFFGTYLQTTTRPARPATRRQLEAEA